MTKSQRLWLAKIPPPLIDGLLGLALAAAVTIAITVAPEQGPSTSRLAYSLGPVIGGLSLLRRRWPRLVLVLSAVALQVYNLFDNPGIFAAIPLSVALATAWIAGHRVWCLAMAIWFGGGPIVFLAVADLPDDMRAQLAYGLVSDVALMAAVLLLGEAVRARRDLDREHNLLLVEQARSEALLLNVLPQSIADRLRSDEAAIADEFTDVTVMFIDLVGFTRHSQGRSPDVLVQELNDLFTLLDGLAASHGLEKIKTIGDAYMVAGGLPEPRPGHAEAVADMALAVQDEVGRRRSENGNLDVRIGIDSGPVVAGVIGRHKFSYDLWGDTVNTASRMESQGEPGRIQVTDRTYQRLKGKYRFERRGLVQVKGKSEMVTWFLVGRDGGSD